MIYAVTINKGKFVKIGFTNNNDLEKRVSQLQTGNPYYIKPEFMVEGTIRQEQTLHASLKTAFDRIRIPFPEMSGIQQNAHS